VESDEKLDLLEAMLQLPSGSLTEETFLEEVDGWEDLQTITNLQMELSNRGVDIPIEELREFERVSELCRLLK